MKVPPPSPAKLRRRGKDKQHPQRGPLAGSSPAGGELGRGTGSAAGDDHLDRVDAAPDRPAAKSSRAGAMPTAAAQTVPSPSSTQLDQLLLVQAQRSTAKKKGLAGAFGSLLSARRTLEVPVADLSSILAAQVDTLAKIQDNLPNRVAGLKHIWPAGELRVRDVGDARLLEITPGKNVHLASLTTEQLRRAHTKAGFSQLVAKLSITKSIYVFAESRDGTTMKLDWRSSGQQKVLLQDAEQNVHVRRKDLTAKMSVAGYLTLRACGEQEVELFAALAAANPRLVTEICTLPYHANVFTPQLLMGLFRAMAPKKGEALEISEKLRQQAVAMDKALSHYYRYAPYSDLQQQLPKLAVKALKADKRANLLIQDPSLYLREIVFLLQEIFKSSSPANDEPDDAESSRLASCAWQLATLVGVSFAYAGRYARETSQDLERAERAILAATEVVTAAMGTVGNTAAVPTGVHETAGVLAGKFADALAQWALRPKGTMDVARMADDLAYLSDSIKRRSTAGFLLPGCEELLRTEFEQLSASLRDSRKVIGEKFSAYYSMYLAYYKEHRLQRSLKYSLST